MNDSTTALPTAPVYKTKCPKSPAFHTLSEHTAIPKTWKKTISGWPWTESLVTSAGPEDVNIVSQILTMEVVSLPKYMLCLCVNSTVHIYTFKQTWYYNLNGMVTFF